MTEKDGSWCMVAPLVHVANERATSPYAGARLKRKGVRAGFPDVAFVLPIPLYIELKTPKGTMSRNQTNWEEYIQSIGMPFFVCRTLLEFQQTVISHMEAMTCAR